MTDKEKMIEITKGAFIKFRSIRKNELANPEDVYFAYTRYFFYMRMLEEVYPDLNREELELEWEIENGR